MSEKPPADPADHAVDFSWRYAEDLDIVAGQAMMDLGLDKDEMGARDPHRPGEHHSFHPEDRTGGGVGVTGQVTVDSGVMNPHLLDVAYDETTQQLWRQTRLRDRVEAIIAHERAEGQTKDHEEALRLGAQTDLPVSHAGRELLRQMERGWLPPHL